MKPISLQLAIPKNFAAFVAKTSLQSPLFNRLHILSAKGFSTFSCLINRSAVVNRPAISVIMNNSLYMSLYMPLLIIAAIRERIAQDIDINIACHVMVNNNVLVPKENLHAVQ